MKLLITTILFFIPFLFAQSDKDLLSEYLKTQLGKYSSFTYEIINNTNNLNIVKINTSQPLRINGSSAVVSAIVNENGINKKSSLVLRLHLFDSVLVAVSDLSKKIKLNADDFNFNLIEVSNINGTPLKDKSVVGPLRLNCSLKKGEVLLKEIIEEIPLVYPGDLVTAELRKGNVIVSFDASVRQEGNKGEVIKIVTSENKILNARVVDNKNVTIE